MIMQLLSSKWFLIALRIQNQHQHIDWKHKRKTAQTTNRQLRRNTNNS